MEYVAKVTTEGGRWLVEFPDCPGCQTFGDTKEQALAMAGEALEGWLEAHVEYGDAPPRPARHRGVPIAVGPRLAVAIQIRWLREDLGLTQRQLAAKAGVTQQQIAKLEKPSGNPTIGTLAAIAKSSGAQFSAVLTLEKSFGHKVAASKRTPRAQTKRASAGAKSARVSHIELTGETQGLPKDRQASLLPAAQTRSRRARPATAS